MGQVSAERMVYEAAEIFMNETKANTELTSDQIRKQIFDFVIKAMDANRTELK